MNLLKPALVPVENAKNFINDRLSGFEPWKVVALTAGATVVCIWVNDQFRQPEPLTKRTRKAVFRFVRSLPILKQRIDAEVAKHCADVNATVLGEFKDAAYVTRLPDKGASREKLLGLVKEYLGAGGVAWSDGKISGAVYNNNKEILEVATQVYSRCVVTNPLHPDAFPGICKMETEIAAMTARLFHGDNDACGVVTSGGTESIVLACKAYREWAYARGIKVPEIVCPVTAHAAFDKAAEMLRMRIRHVRLDPATMKVDVGAMGRAIGRNTCMLVGSAPNFPHGIIDPIVDIAELGVRYNIPVHVDACLGGFLIAFMDKAGYPLDSFDFRLKGVTSISADTHKYGMAPKGTSVIMYRNKELRHLQYFVHPDWPGGIYGSTTLAGSRPGALIAACWATLMYMGMDSYVEVTKKIIGTARYISEQLNGIKGVRVLGEPQVSVVAFDSDEFHIYHLFDGLVAKGWHINRLQFPPCLHICVTSLHTQPGVAEKFVSDVREIATELVSKPREPLAGESAIYGTAQTIPDRSIIGEMVCAFLDGAVTPKNVGKSDTKNGDHK